MMCAHSLVSCREEAYTVPVPLLGLGIGTLLRDVLRHGVGVHDLEARQNISERVRAPHGRVWHAASAGAEGQRRSTHDAGPGGVPSDLRENNVASFVCLLLSLSLTALFTHCWIVCTRLASFWVVRTVAGTARAVVARDSLVVRDEPASANAGPRLLPMSTLGPCASSPLTVSHHPGRPKNHQQYYSDCRTHRERGPQLVAPARHCPAQ